MPPAPRLRSLLARLLRRAANALEARGERRRGEPPGEPGEDGSEPPGERHPGGRLGEPPGEPGSGNEHWLAVVRARAPELLAGGGIHHGGVDGGRYDRIDGDTTVSAAENRTAALREPPSRPEPGPSTARGAVPVRQRRHPRRPQAPTLTAAARVLRRRLGLRLDPRERPSSARAARPAFPQPDVPHGTPPDVVPAPEPPRRAAGNPDFGLPRSVLPEQRQPVWPNLPRFKRPAQPQFDGRDDGERPSTAAFPPPSPATAEPPAFAEPPPDGRPHSADTRTWSADARTWGADTRTWGADAPGERAPWPELPDDGPLWEVPVSVFDDAEVRRLDDEQRGW